MDYQTSIALNNSIEHWEQNLYRTENDIELLLGPENCALCALFYFGRKTSYRCIDCPIFILTKEKYCRNTPYEDIIVFKDFVKFGSSKQFLIKRIKKMIELLKSCHDI